MTPDDNPNDRCWALVKFEVTAAHCSRIYSFSHYVGKTPADVAKAISDECLGRIDEAMSYEDQPDDEFQADRTELEQSIQRFVVAHIQDGGKSPQSKNSIQGMRVGYAAYDFVLVAAGFEQQFLSALMAAIAGDSDFDSFLEMQLEELDSRDDEPENDEQLLALEFQRLRPLAPADLAEEDVAGFLSRIEKFVLNDTM